MKVPIVKNTVTNYLMVVVRLLQGILVTRWLLQGLGETYYGLWALLWSLFGYGLLLDFGLGVSAQKFTASELYRTDSEKYNMVISSIFSFHLAMSGVILLGNFIASFFLSELFKVSDPALLAYGRQCFWLFGIGTACIFPLGIFPEIMVGLQKIYLRNYVNFVFKVIELVGVGLIVWLGGELRILICFSLGVTLLTNLTMGILVCRSIPSLRLRVCIAGKIFREITHYSSYMYAISFSRFILTMSVRPLIGFFCGLNSVGFFQLGSRIPTYCNQITNQYQENVGPMAAGLFANGKIAELRNMIFQSMRWNSFLATGMMMLAFVLTDVGLEALFKVRNPEVSLLCRWMLVSMYVTAVARAVPQQLMVMTERHRMIAVIAVVEAFINLGLYLILLPRYGIVSIVWTVLGCKLAIAVFVILPYLVKHLKFQVGQFLWQIYILPAFAVIPPCLFLWWFDRLLPQQEHAWKFLLIGGAISAFLYLLCAWLWVLRGEEREKFLALIRKFLPRPRT